jgi:2-oxo-4-hydroxy-4-carboxy--5-ureidoimidazoline (OHCU) decarboxylase
MTRSIYVFVLAVAVSLASLSAVRPAIAAHHEPVTQVVIVEVAPGKLESYRQEVKKLTAVLSRLGSSARPRMWQATAAGPNTGNVMVGLEYPNAAAWAADSAKIQRDAEWQRIVAGLDKLRTLVSSSIWRDISPNPGEASMAGAGVLLVTGVQVKPGKLDTYLQRLQTGRAILERLGLKARMRVWHAELAGPETGSVAVGVEYPDLATYVADQAKLNADAEWKKLLSGLDDLRTLSGRSLFREITP